MKPPDDWIQPAWPAPRNVRALITTRSGGASSGAHATFNLGLHAGDDPQSVAANRAFLRGLLPQEPRWLAQEHGVTVVDADTVDTPPRADASIARATGTVCAVMVADCLPVLFSDRDGTLVAAAHAGWRGLAKGVLENTVRATGADPARLLAYLGPAIGPHAFEVGDDVRDAFLARNDAFAAEFAPHKPGKWLADIYGLARRALAHAGVAQVYGGGLCTVSDPARFFSYRRDRTTGRMAALIWRTD